MAQKNNLNCLSQSKKSSIRNPYQQAKFPDFRRLSVLTMMLSAPILLWVVIANSYAGEGDGSIHGNGNHVKNAFIATRAGIGKRFAKRSRNALENGRSSKSYLSDFANEDEPHFREMAFVLSGESQIRTFDAYMEPDVSTFYRDENDGTTTASGNGNRDSADRRRVVTPEFKGQAGKFINVSPFHLMLYWDDGRDGVRIADLPPFEAAGTATFPVHKFFLSRNIPKKHNDKDDDDEDMEIMERIHMQRGESVYIYNAFDKGLAKVEELDDDELELYHLQINNIEFAKQYREFTGREWLSLYPLRSKPMYNMWNADYYKQQHWVATKETHFVKEPPEHLLGRLSDNEMHRDRSDPIKRDHRKLEQYRSSSSVKVTMEEGGDLDIGVQSDEEPESESESDAFLNMTLTVLSTHPRVFEIKNFLSPVEVDHIVHMATGMKLSLSTTSGSDGRDARSDTRTRTSKNSWVNRSRSPIMDSIYARAADLMQIDEALLRHRNEKEDNEHHFAKKGHNTSHKHGAAHRRSNAEDLQLVHYSTSEQYTAHHDFSYPSLHHQDQPARFATLLLYLNEGMKGGQTTFPRWRNGHTGKKLTVEPEIGKAILFYNQLPDGNMDDLSQHAAEPVQHGEKWLINLWTWDPSFR